MKLKNDQKDIFKIKLNESTEINNNNNLKTSSDDQIKLANINLKRNLVNISIFRKFKRHSINELPIRQNQNYIKK